MSALPILPRYFLRLFAPLFGLCLAVFTGVLLMNQFLKLFNLAVMKGISLVWIASCFARLLPYFLGLALPMAFLVATLMTLGQLSESGEVTALRASGFSFSEMTRPFLLVAIALSGLLFAINHKYAPEGFHSFRKQYLQAAKQIARVDLTPGSFMRLGPWKLYARQADSASGRLEGVYLVRADPGSAAVRVNARAGLLRLDAGRGASLELEDGELQLPNADPRRFTAGRFARYRVAVPLAAPPGARHQDIPEINSAGLLARRGDPSTTQQHRVEYAVELAVRGAAALSPFVFFWIAAPLGLSFTKRSRGAGFVASVAILLLFYSLLGLGIALGRRHEPLAFFAPWGADAVCLALGAWLTRRAVAK